MKNSLTVMDILELCNILENFQLITSKAVTDILYEKFCIRVTSRITEQLDIETWQQTDLRKSRNIGKMSKLHGEKA